MMIILDIEFATLAVIIMAWLTIAVLSLKGIGYLADALWRAALGAISVAPAKAAGNKQEA